MKIPLNVKKTHKNNQTAYFLQDEFKNGQLDKGILKAIDGRLHEEKCEMIIAGRRYVMVIKYIKLILEDN